MNTTAPVRKNALQVWMRKRSIQKNWQFYLMLLIPIAWYVIFCYMPMYGVTLAFKKYSASKGITGSAWVEPWYRWFLRYYSSPYFARTISNTFILAASSLVFGFPLPIMLALMLNEISNKRYQKFVQNITYVPHFLSIVVIVGLLSSFTNRDYGIVNKIIAASGGKVDNWMQVPSLFRPLYVGSGVWQNMGWDSIIYIAALAGVDPQLHESAKIDGANRFQCLWHINIPCIMPTIVILLILNSGRILSVGFEKVYLMQNNLNMAVSDVIATYIYRISLLESNQFELSTAIGLFNSAANCIMLVIVNGISAKLGETKLW
ncbi:MAG: ABC transporter permease [Christensenellales bacterium]|jgi:putative aldouronate transport system permease protein